MSERMTFRLFKGDKVVRFEVISEYHWKVIGKSDQAAAKIGDEVSPIRQTSWRRAKRRVNSHRTSLSPNMYVLLRGEGYEKSDEEVRKLLRIRAFDPDVPPVA